MERKPAVAVEIRRFAPADQEGVAWLFARTPPWGRTYPRPPAVPEDLADVQSSFPERAWVAVEQDQAGEAVVGFAAVVAVDDHAMREVPEFLRTGPAMSRVRWVSVAPERWRLGIGRRLTQAAIDWARTRGSGSVILETTVQQEGAIALYESMGFVERGRTTVGIYRQVWMELIL